MRMRNFLIHGSMATCLLLSMAACDPKPRTSSSEETVSHNSADHSAVLREDEAEAVSFKKAICVLHPTKGNKVTGQVTFTQSDSGMVVVADLTGLTPGKHGFHVHEFGDCSSPDASSAGGHFNPEGKEHGAPHADKRHVGDLGNVEAGNDGKAHYQFLDSLMTFSGTNSIIGRSLIVHAGEDDLKSQPTGDSGDRIACGVIGIAKQ